jgi:hypothetical protein
MAKKCSQSSRPRSWARYGVLLVLVFAETALIGLWTESYKAIYTVLFGVAAKHVVGVRAFSGYVILGHAGPRAIACSGITNWAGMCRLDRTDVLDPMPPVLAIDPGSLIYAQSPAISYECTWDAMRIKAFVGTALSDSEARIYGPAASGVSQGHSIDCRIILIPLGLPAVILMILILWALGPTIVHWLRLSRGLCPVCGYDWSHSRDRCSECGHARAIR